jgi:hypothetical protein
MALLRKKFTLDSVYYETLGFEPRLSHLCMWVYNNFTILSMYPKKINRKRKYLMWFD